MEFLASDFKRKGRKKKNKNSISICLYIYGAISTPNLRMLPAEQRGWGREVAGLVLGGVFSSMGCSTPKRRFLPRKADSRARGDLVVVKKPREAPASCVWEGGRKAQRGREHPTGSSRGFYSPITFGTVSDASGKSPANLSPGWEACPCASPHGWVSSPGGGRAGV